MCEMHFTHSFKETTFNILERLRAALNVNSLDIVIRRTRKRPTGDVTATLSKSTKSGSTIRILAFAPISDLRYGEFQIDLAAGLEEALIRAFSPPWNGETVVAAFPKTPSARQSTMPRPHRPRLLSLNMRLSRRRNQPSYRQARTIRELSPILESGSARPISIKALSTQALTLARNSVNMEIG